MTVFQVGIVARGMGEAIKKPLPGVEKKRRAKHDLISPGRTGWDLAPASPLRATGCCGFYGPYPSATLDKMLTKLSDGIVEETAEQSNPFPETFLPSGSLALL